ncbi:MAG: pitrilysin family protein [Alphaproteobacteria bacterium]
MTLLKRLTAVATLAIMGVMTPDSGRADLFNPEVFTLDNGMTVAVIENNRAPVVTHMIWYKVGSIDEPPGKSGIAHFLEHLMFKGTEKIAPGEYSRIIRSNAGEDNASTSYDFTNYFQSIHRDKLGMLMELEADRMLNLRLSDEVVLPERDVILDERRQRIDRNPGAQLSVSIDHAMLPNSAYGRPIIGWEHEMEELTTQDALDWVQRWYGPNNAIVVVAGDTTVEEVRALAEQHYGPIPPRDDLPTRVVTEIPPLTGTIRIDKVDERVKQPEVRLMYLGPCRGNSEPEEFLALDIFQEAFSEGASSKMYRELVVKRKMATAGGLYHWSWRRNACQSTLYGSPADGHTLEELEAALQEVLAEVLEEGLTEEQVRRAVRQLKITSTFARDSVHGPAYWVGQTLVLDADLRGLEDSAEIMDSLTAEDVMRVARKYYDQPPRVIATLQGPPAVTQATADKADTDTATTDTDSAGENQ